MSNNKNFSDLADAITRGHYSDFIKYLSQLKVNNIYFFSPDVNYSISQTSNIKIIEHFMSYYNGYFHSSLILNSNLTVDDFNLLLTNCTDSIKFSLLYSEHTPIDILRKLLYDPNSSIASLAKTRCKYI